MVFQEAKGKYLEAIWMVTWVLFQSIPFPAEIQDIPISKMCFWRYLVNYISYQIFYFHKSFVISDK